MLSKLVLWKETPRGLVDRCHSFGDTAAIFRVVLKMVTLCTSETFVSTFKSTRRYYPEDKNLHLHRSDNLKCHMLMLNSYYERNWLHADEEPILKIRQ